MAKAGTLTSPHGGGQCYSYYEGDIRATAGTLASPYGGVRGFVPSRLLHAASPSPSFRAPIVPFPATRCFITAASFTTATVGSGAWAKGAAQCHDG